MKIFCNNSCSSCAAVVSRCETPAYRAGHHSDRRKKSTWPCSVALRRRFTSWHGHPFDFAQDRLGRVRSRAGRLALMAIAWSYTVNIRRRAKSTRPLAVLGGERFVGVLGGDLRPSYVAQTALFAVLYRLHKHGWVWIFWQNRKRRDEEI